jgi:hypothetical protein
MDCYDFVEKTSATASRLNARVASQAADIREHTVRSNIAVNLMMRGIGDIPTILLVLGYEDAADSLVMAKINPDNIRDIVGQSYMDWEKFVALKMLNAKNTVPATDETEDDLPFPADESEVDADEA